MLNLVSKIDNQISIRAAAGYRRTDKTGVQLMMQRSSLASRFFVATLVAAMALGTGCKKQEAAPTQVTRTDAEVTSDIQAKITAESALGGQAIQVAVANGVATLTGTANDPASRALAANDAGSVAGVRTVINDLTLQPIQQAAAPAPVAPPQPAKAPATRDHKRHHTNVAALAQPEPQPQPEQAAQPPTPSESEVAAPPPPPPPPPPPAQPPKPVEKTVTVSEGTIVPVRITEALDSSVTHENDAIHGSLAGDLIVDGMIAVPQGAPVVGRVVDARDAAHFKGTSLLSIELTQVKVQGREIPVVTDAFTKEGAARGKNTAAKAGGGAALGAIIGAIAGGGKGAAIGAVAGGGAGTAANGVTRGQQVSIPSETLVNFRLQTSITVNTSRAVGAPRRDDDSSPQLQPR
jgi:hypothetical protein